MKHHVYVHTETISKDGDWVTVHTLGFYEGYVDQTDKRKYLGQAEVTFPIKFPLTLDNGLVINEGDYYSKYSE